MGDGWQSAFCRPIFTGYPHGEGKIATADLCTEASISLRISRRLCAGRVHDRRWMEMPPWALPQTPREGEDDRLAEEESAERKFRPQAV